MPEEIYPGDLLRLALELWTLRQPTLGDRLITNSPHAYQGAISSLAKKYRGTLPVLEKLVNYSDIDNAMEGLRASAILTYLHTNDGGWLLHMIWDDTEESVMAEIDKFFLKNKKAKQSFISFANELGNQLREARDKVPYYLEAT